MGFNMCRCHDVVRLSFYADRVLWPNSMGFWVLSDCNGAISAAKTGRRQVRGCGMGTCDRRMALFDYLGNNPSKGGLFRNGPMNNGDGIASRPMPTFFETFPVLLLDNQGTVRADIPFHRAAPHVGFISVAEL